MRTPRRTAQFKKDVRLVLRRGKDSQKLEDALSHLIDGKPLDPKYRDHPLKGEFKGRRECHLEPDWLLIYKPDNDAIIFERTGSHSDLFE